MSELRVIVCGGRDYTKAWRVFEALETIYRNHHGTLVIIEGCARGADQFASNWAEFHCNDRNVEHHPHPPDWKKYGLSAGRMRNAEMIREEDPHVVLAFPGGNGTRDMVKQARRAGLIVIYAEDMAEIRHKLGFITDDPKVRK